MRRPPLSARDHYTAAEMAEAMGCAERTVIRGIDAGLIPSPGPGGGGRRHGCAKAAFRAYLETRGIPLSMLHELERRSALSEAFLAGGMRRG